MSRQLDDNRDNTNVEAVFRNVSNRRILFKTKGMGSMYVDPGCSVPLTSRQADLVGSSRPEGLVMEKYKPQKHGPKKKDL